MFHPETAYELAKERQRKIEDAAHADAPTWTDTLRRKAEPIAAFLSGRSSG